MVTGTNHFVSYNAAKRYFAPYGFGDEDIQRKIADGGIKIGKPETTVEQILITIDKDTRYAIVE